MSERAREGGLLVRPISPFSHDLFLAYIGARAMPGIEFVADDSYKRTIRIENEPATLELNFRDDAVLVRCHPDPGDELVRPLVERLLAPNTDVGPIEVALSADPQLAPIVARQRGLRIPGSTDPFELTVRAILGQQISVAAAARLAGKIAARYGQPVSGLPHGLTTLFPAAGDLASADMETLGIPRSRAGAIRALAEQVDAAQLQLAGDLPPGVIRRSLLDISGIGPWTASYAALRGLGDGDAIPCADLGLRTALGEPGTPISEKEVEARASAWAPWRGYGAMHLWATLI